MLRLVSYLLQQSKHYQQRTASRESFAAKRLPVPRSCLKCCTQSLGEIHCIGERRTLHAGLQLKVAELHNRNMCEYTYNFKENPLLGAGINRQLAESFRDGNRSTKPPLAFTAPSRQDLRHARLRPGVPEYRRAEDSLGFGYKPLTAPAYCRPLRPSQVKFSWRPATLGVALSDERWAAYSQNGWQPGDRPNENTSIIVLLALRQRNLDLLERKARAVSDPNSPEYGRYLERDELYGIAGSSAYNADIVEEFFSKLPGKFEFSFGKDFARFSARGQNPQRGRHDGFPRSI
eukprot:g26132.t1